MYCGPYNEIGPCFHLCSLRWKGDAYARSGASPSQIRTSVAPPNPPPRRQQIGSQMRTFQARLHGHMRTQTRTSDQSKRPKNPVGPCESIQALDARSPVWLLLLLRLDLALAQGRGSTCCSSSCWPKDGYMLGNVMICLIHGHGSS